MLGRAIVLVLDVELASLAITTTVKPWPPVECASHPWDVARASPFGRR